MKIYQVSNELTRSFGFMGLRMMESLEVEVDIRNYDMVYENNNFILASESNSDTLNRLFKVFNVIIPEGYTGRSLTDSDIVEIDSSYYFCDSYCWTKIEINI